MQWDGGPYYSIHGGSARYLPVLSLDGLEPVGTGVAPEMAFKLLADGYSRPDIVLPIQFMTQDQATTEEVSPTPEWL